MKRLGLVALLFAVGILASGCDSVSGGGGGRTEPTPPAGKVAGPQNGPGGGGPGRPGGNGPGGAPTAPGS